MKRLSLFALSLAGIALASVHAQTSTDRKPLSGGKPARDKPFADETVATLQEPWAMAFEPGTGRLFVTERGGTVKIIDKSRAVGSVTGVPQVAHAGQGGLGDIAFAPDYARSHAIYLTFAEPAERKTGRAAMGRGTLACADQLHCRIDGFKVLWRQSMAVDKPVHFSHRMLFSPDGKYLFLTSGERFQFTPAQGLGNNLGKVLRLLPDGRPAPGNPFADKGPIAAQIWSYGHRNLLGIAWDSRGRLWETEHGPKGGDEINLITRGANYGWPVVSYGDNYDGSPIPSPTTRPDLAAPATYWNPVIGPGGMIIYSGKLFAGWKDRAILPSLSAKALVIARLEGAKATEAARYDMGARMRAIVQAPDGTIWLAQDGKDAKILRLTPRPSR